MAKENNGLLIIVAVVIAFIFLYNAPIPQETQQIISVVGSNQKFDVSLREEITEDLKQKGTVLGKIMGAVGGDPDEPTYDVIIETTDNSEVIQEEKITPKVRIDEINIVADSFTFSELVNMSRNNDVIMMYWDKPVEEYLDESVNEIRAEPLIDTQNTFGSGVKVCILDTGIDDSHNYIGNLPDNNKKSFVEGLSYFDGRGHGTHVAGTIVSNDLTYGGIAQNIDLYIGKVLDNSGSGSTSQVLAGLFWCVDEVGADIVSLSLGGGLFKKVCDEEYSCQFFNELSDKSIIVAASGNSGIKGGGSPACCSSVISVASFNKKTDSWFGGSGKLSSFSSRNQNVKIGAIGAGVTSTTPGNNFAKFSGTSMATPHISGAFALLKSLKPSATNQELINAMLSTAIDKGYESYEQGSGLANIYRSCEKLRGDCSNVFKSNYEFSSCGNNIKEGNEECDGTDVGTTCLDLNLSIGKLKCTNSCKFDYSSCGVSECVTDSDCETKAVISCSRDSSGIYHRIKHNPFCSNEGICLNFGVRLSEEICDKEEICSEDGCIKRPHCGDNIKGGMEQCDGIDFGGNTCETFGLRGGSLSCDNLCNYDTSKCSMPDKVGKVFLYDGWAYDNEYCISKCKDYDENNMYFAENCGDRLSRYSGGEWRRIYSGTSCHDLIKEHKVIETKDGLCSDPKLVTDNIFNNFVFSSNPASNFGSNIYMCAEKNTILTCGNGERHREILFTILHKTGGPPRKARSYEIETKSKFELRCDEISINCVDTDGLDIGNAGEINYKGRTYEDKCRKSSKRKLATKGDRVREYYCDKDRRKSKYFYCGAGISCVDGSCIIPTQEPVPEPPEQVGDYVKFRTSSLDYGRGSAIASLWHRSPTCSKWLINYGYVTKKSSSSGTCETDKELSPLLLSGLPVSSNFNTHRGGGDGNLRLYMGEYNDENWVCENDLDGRGYYKAKYYREDSDKGMVSSKPGKTGSIKELTCFV